MLKLVGAVLLLAGCCGWSIGGALHLRNRKRNLASLTQSLELMKSEIGSRGTSLPETAEILAAAVGGTVGDFYREVHRKLNRDEGVPFEELWKEAVLSQEELLLTEEESRELCALGYHLGKFDQEYQEKSIALARERMAEYARQAGEKCDREWKVQTFVGAAAGLVTVLILL